MVRMWRGCVRPINRTNGGLTAWCALREEDPPVAAAAAGWAERSGGARRSRGEGERPTKKENPRQAPAVGYSSPSGSYYSLKIPFAAWIYSHIRGGGRSKGEDSKMHVE